MKRYLILFIVFAVLLNTYSFAVADDLSLNGEGAILIDYDSGRILYEKNAHKKLYPASTTKMMTAILTLEHGKMDDMVTIDPEIIGMTEGSHIALDYDEVMSVEDLLHALMIASANDAAAALGKYVAGSIDGFVKMMNDKARELGATNTNFTNPSGLHDDNHYSTAYDLYLIARYAMENKSFRELVNKSSYTIGPTNKKSEPRLLHTTNRFLYGNDRINVDGKTIPIRFDGVAGIKTGTTGEARNCLVSYANRDGKRMITVVLKAEGKEVYADTYKLLDYGYSNFETIALGREREFIDNVEIKNGTLPVVSAILDRDILFTVKKDEQEEIKRKVVLNEDLKAPLSEGDLLGSVEYYLGDELIAEGNLVSTLSVGLLPPVKLYKRILDKWYIALLLVFIAYRCFHVFIRARKRRTSKYYGYTSMK